MKFVAALRPRASVHDLTLYPTFPKVYSAAETGPPHVTGRAAFMRPR